MKAIRHAGLALKPPKKAEIKFINAEYLTPPSISTAFHSHDNENSPPSKQRKLTHNNKDKDQMNSEEVAKRNHQDALNCLQACQ